MVPSRGHEPHDRPVRASPQGHGPGGPACGPVPGPGAAHTLSASLTARSAPSPRLPEEVTRPASST